jgi:hypothetical protein
LGRRGNPLCGNWPMPHPGRPTSPIWCRSRPSVSRPESDRNGEPGYPGNSWLWAVDAGIRFPRPTIMSGPRGVGVVGAARYRVAGAASPGREVNVQGCRVVEGFHTYATVKAARRGNPARYFDSGSGPVMTSSPGGPSSRRKHKGGPAGWWVRPRPWGCRSGHGPLLAGFPTRCRRA